MKSFKKFVVFTVCLVFIGVSSISYAEESKKNDSEEGFCAVCKENKGKAAYQELTWSPVSQITKSGSFVVATLEDGSRISTLLPDRASLFCMAMASGLNVIVHWNGIASYDMIYVGR